MELRWAILVLLVVFETTNAEDVDKTLMDMIALDDLPLTKSFGYSYGDHPRNTLDDARLNREYMEQYQEMLKASQETYDTVSDGQKLLRKDGRRQRHAHQVQSPVRRRRARSEALRRDKLNSQSLRSHVEHARSSSSREAHSRESNDY